MDFTRNNEEIIELSEDINNSIDGIIDLLYTYSECKNVNIEYSNKTIISLIKNTKITVERLLMRATEGNKEDEKRTWKTN